MAAHWQTDLMVARDKHHLELKKRFAEIKTKSGILRVEQEGDSTHFVVDLITADGKRYTSIINGLATLIIDDYTTLSVPETLSTEEELGIICITEDIIHYLFSTIQNIEDFKDVAVPNGCIAFYSEKEKLYTNIYPYLKSIKRGRDVIYYREDATFKVFTNKDVPVALNELHNVCAKCKAEATGNKKTGTCRDCIFKSLSKKYTEAEPGRPVLHSYRMYHNADNF